ncbi:heme exporter protein CcmB [Luminiphilus syltensis NOR5-1B]|uniref:Heme exporter protein B n=1 Tax=Luminiphilus syltensis NOR5-1B TaxID=565045 RepID=B8KS80_9GAMM|nr:heme exporter protein CcmB [Luminiphilus syltensis]EED35363.1 heme exporter protein CcmB [Luminiphilus syltensis NOR5-1B]
MPELGTFLWTQCLRQIKSRVASPGEIANPLLFFLMVVALFPIGLGPDPDRLATLAPGILWVVALLSNLIVSGRLFAGDYEDGSLEQLALAPYPLALSALTEVLAHWLLSGVTLALVSPVFALLLNLPNGAIPTLVGSLVLGSLCLSLIGGIGAALTVGIRRGGLLLSLLIIPLYVPVLVFGTSAVVEAAAGGAPQIWLALLGAVAAGGLVVAPLAIGAGLRISLDN